MKVTSVYIGHVRKISKNYNSWDYSVGFTIEIEDDEIDEVRRKAFKKCREMISEEIKEDHDVIL